jgi:hypothetical protein
MHGDAVAEKAVGSRLRIEVKHLPGGVVVEDKLCAGYVFGTLRRFGKSLIGGASAADDYAGPWSGIRFGLRHGYVSRQQDCHEKSRESFQNRAATRFDISLDS